MRARENKEGYDHIISLSISDSSQFLTKSARPTQKRRAITKKKTREEGWRGFTYSKGVVLEYSAEGNLLVLQVRPLVLATRVAQLARSLNASRLTNTPATCE